MKFNWSQIKKRNIYVIKGLRVEPIAFLNFLALGIFGLVSQVGIYRVICHHTLGDDPRFDCSSGGREHGGHGHHGRHNATGLNDSHIRKNIASDLSPGVRFSVNHSSSDHHHRNGSAWNGTSGHHGKNGSPNQANFEPNEAADEEKIHAELETKVQKAAITWNLIFHTAHTIPALFADTFLGALGDRHGRKANILIGLAGLMMSMYPLTFIFTYEKAPLFILIITNLLSGFTGYMSIIMISCFAYLADTVVDHQMLTVRMTYFSVVMSVAGIFSPLIGNGLLLRLSYAQVTLICQGILTLAFFLTLLIVRQRPPILMRKIMLEEYIKEHGQPPPKGNEKFEKYRIKTLETNNNEKTLEKIDAVAPEKKNVVKNYKADFVSIWKSFILLWKEVYVTFTKPRPGHARLYLMFASFVYFLHTMFEGGLRSNVFSIYVQKAPFYWGAPEISSYRSINSALHLVGSMIGIVVLKKYLKLSDTTVILLAMGTHCIECVLFAFAQSSAALYVAAAAGCLAHMISPCIKSFISQLVNPDEVGKSFTAFGIATNVAHMGSSVLYSSIYYATVGWFAGFSFLIAGVLELICMAMFFWLHCDYHEGSILNWIKVNICVRIFKRKSIEAKIAPTENGLQMQQALDVAIVESTTIVDEHL